MVAWGEARPIGATPPAEGCRDAPGAERYPPAGHGDGGASPPERNRSALALPFARSPVCLAVLAWMRCRIAPVFGERRRCARHVVPVRAGGAPAETSRSPRGLLEGIVQDLGLYEDPLGGGVGRVIGGEVTRTPRVRATPCRS